MRSVIKLPCAIRVYPETDESEALSDPSHSKRRVSQDARDAFVVLDTESRTDTSQRFTFGSYRVFSERQCVEEVLSYADDLPAEDLKILENYASSHRAETADARKLRLLPLKAALRRLYALLYKARLPLIAFNLPFDLSRIAFEWRKAYESYAGGYSLGIWHYVKDGRKQPNQFRPRIAIKHIDSKRSLVGFLSRRGPDKDDLIPEGSADGKPLSGYVFRGYFLDLRTLGSALTAKALTLDSACEEFGLLDRKVETESHGVVTEQYIDYHRNDVRITAKLAGVMLEEFYKHPLNQHPSRVFSIASMGKLYLRQMGIEPILERQPDFSKACLGHAQTAFFGGRASTRIRKVPMPVVFLDFLSMYTTVNANMDLWKFVIAREIKIIDHCQREIEDFLRSILANPDCLFDPATWKRLTGFVRVVPDGDVLPLRAKYGSGEAWNIGINYVYGDMKQPDDAFWYALPDVAFSVITTGKVPTIIDAFRIEPSGIQEGLTNVKLRGEVEIDPARQDFFRVVVEERKRLGKSNEQLSYFLKILASAASYGIYAEMNRRESAEPVLVTCHSLDAQSYECRVAHPEDRGQYFFSPMASLITSGARLMLGLLEHCLSELGGAYVMEDTDSMAIVATENGGLVPCPKGPHRMKDGREAVLALSWQQVEQVRQRLAALNPYRWELVPGSVLRLEDDNRDPATGKQRQIYCYSISAKRYALFCLDENENPVLLARGSNNPKDHWSQHGLGHLLNPKNEDDEEKSEDEFSHLLNPNDPKSVDGDWIRQIWNNIVRKALGLPVDHLQFENAPAVSRVTVSSPKLMQPLLSLNRGKDYATSIKPFNFLLCAHVSGLHVPAGADPKHFHLIAPYDPDSRNWTKMDWVDQYSGNRYRITVENDESAHLAGGPVLVKTYAEVIVEYETHPEPKCADADGSPCGRSTIGLLQRRHVQIGQIKPIGKESNRLEEQLTGLIHDEQEALTIYPDPKRSGWLTEIVPALAKLLLPRLIAESGMSRSELQKIRTGRQIPHRRNREKLISILQRWKQNNHGEPAKRQRRRKPGTNRAKSARPGN